MNKFLIIVLFSCLSTYGKSPNIIYILVDDLGYGDLGCYGQEKIKTPNLDQMAKEGMKFTDHYSGSAVCRPSRLSLWTGRSPLLMKLTDNNKYILDEKLPIIPKVLKNASYVTGAVGKWSLGKEGTKGHPNKHGIDYFFGYLDQVRAHNYYPEYLWENDKKIPLAGNKIHPSPKGENVVSEKRVTYSHDIITDKAFEFIRKNSKDNFLLHIHWTIPHANNQGTKVYKNGMEINDWGIYKDKDWPETEKGFAAMIALLDKDMGRLFALLKELDIDDNTVVFFTSDNGPHKEGGHKDDFFKSSGAVRGKKRDLYEGGIRVPLIVRWPNTIKANTTSNHISAIGDFMATACDIAKIDKPKTSDGLSFLPELLGKEQKKHKFMYWHFNKKKAYRIDNYKILHLKKKWYLFDLSKDLKEEHNLAEEQPELLNKLLSMVNFKKKGR